MSVHDEWRSPEERKEQDRRNAMTGIERMQEYARANPPNSDLTHLLLALFTRDGGPTLPKQMLVTVIRDAAHPYAVRIYNADSVLATWWKEPPPDYITAALKWQVEDWAIKEHGDPRWDSMFDEDTGTVMYRVAFVFVGKLKWTDWFPSRLEALVCAAERAVEESK